VVLRKVIEFLQERGCADLPRRPASAARSADGMGCSWRGSHGLMR
jgi:hypothetical protein